MNFSKLLYWFSASLEGEDGKLSSKKATIFAFILMFAFMITYTAIIFYKHPNANQVFPDIAWIMCASGAIGFTATQTYQSVKRHSNEKI
jgi:hypothetical protein